MLVPELVEQLLSGDLQLQQSLTGMMVSPPSAALCLAALWS